MAGKHNDINDFISHIKNVGLPTASHFQVNIPNGDRSVNLLCDDVFMPGMSIMTQEIRTMGEVSEMAYGVTYPPVSMTFLLDNKFECKQFIHDWMDMVYNRQSRTVGYYSDYVADITIEALDKMGNIIYAITLFEAYPKSCADIAFNNGNHEVLKLSVQFIYKYWEDSFKQTPPKEVTPSMFNFDIADNTDLNYRLETLKTKPKESFFNFDSPDNTDIGSKLAKFGPGMGTDLNRASKAVSASSLNVSLPGNSQFGSQFGSSISTMGNSVAAVGNVIGDIGRSIRSATAPLAAIGGTVNSLSNTVRAVDSVLKTVGINNSGLSNISKDLNKIGGEMNKVATLGGFPGKLGALGGSMGALGGSFQTINKSFETMSNVPDQLKKSTAKLGELFSKNGDETATAAGELRTQIDNGVINA